MIEEILIVKDLEGKYLVLIQVISQYLLEGKKGKVIPMLNSSSTTP
jgi:hypothetical protein